MGLYRESSALEILALSWRQSKWCSERLLLSIDLLYRLSYRHRKASLQFSSTLAPTSIASRITSNNLPSWAISIPARSSESAGRELACSLSERKTQKETNSRRKPSSL